MTGDKGFHTFDELVGLLQARGVVVGSETKTILKRESYYAVVNGYKDLFIDKEQSQAAGEDRYKRGTRFDEIYHLFCVDRDLRAALMMPLLVAETTLKTLTVHVFCECFSDRGAYLDPSNYSLSASKAEVVAETIASLTRALDVQGDRHKKDFINHYLSKHKHVPLWVLANYLTFGVMSKFYSALRESTQAAICRQLSAYASEVKGAEGLRFEPYHLGLVFRALSDFRNICAHEERLYCVRLGKARDVRVRTLLPYLDAVLPPADYAHLAEAIRVLITECAAGFATISIDDVLVCMGFKSTEELEALLS